MEPEGFAWPVGTLLLCREKWQAPFLCQVVAAKKFGVLVTDVEGGLGEVTWDHRHTLEEVTDEETREEFERDFAARRFARRVESEG